MYCSAAYVSMHMYVFMYCSAAYVSMHMYVCIVVRPCVNAHVCMQYRFITYAHVLQCGLIVHARLGLFQIRQSTYSPQLRLGLGMGLGLGFI